MSKSIAECQFIKPMEKDKINFEQKIKLAQNRREESMVSEVDKGYGSDEDELFYDADSEETKNFFWRNN